MTDVKHTPGPWTLETVTTQCGICHKVGPFPWKHGKQNHACIYADYPSDGPIEYELLANARLIAAAPDLLEALMAYHKAYDENPHLGPRGSAVDQAFIKARAAIEKATGETS